jgi:hypothetical protein
MVFSSGPLGSSIRFSQGRFGDEAILTGAAVAVRNSDGRALPKLRMLCALGKAVGFTPVIDEVSEDMSWAGWAMTANGLPVASHGGTAATTACVRASLSVCCT